MSIRIGYQGDEGSNAEEASKKIAQKLKIENVKLIPLVSSKEVISKLKNGQIDYAVVATKNTIGGVVSETFESIKNEYLELVSTEIIPIHHCIFIHSDSKVEDIKEVASHIQAIRQTENNIKKLFPDCKTMEIEDTAIGAKYLSSGILSKDTAVICRKNAGEKYNLKLVYENIEDDRNNQTEFRVFKLPTLNYQNDSKPSFFERIKYQFINEKGLGFLSKLLLIVTIFLSFYVSQLFKMSKIETAITMGGYLSAIFLFLSSDRLKNSIQYTSVTGYWKYYSLSDNKNNVGEEQKLDVPRIVRIEVIDGELVFNGYMCDKENVPMFESTRVLLSPSGRGKGSLVYWYGNPNEKNRGINISGLVDLNWKNKYPATRINRMSGHYEGRITKDSGDIEYLRITKEEYEAHKNCEFL